MQLQKSAEVSTLEARISELTAAASVAQESSQKQVEELETRIQMLESELAMQVEERESASALLQEVRRKIALLRDFHTLFRSPKKCKLSSTKLVN